MGVNISIIRDGNFRHPRYANFRPRHKYGLIPLGRAARNWCHEIITLDFKIREAVQREIYITEELEARRKSDPSEPISDRERAICKDWERDLKTLAKAYWEYERKLYHLEVSAPSEIAMRAYKTLREDEYWYLSSWLREDCIRRDGCCARQCGCCEKPRNTHRRLRLGHCTIECGCCIRERGFDKLDPSLSRGREEFYGLSWECRSYDIDRYSMLMERAYIWGFDTQQSVFRSVIQWNFGGLICDVNKLK